MSRRLPNVAIDGLAASGKTTVARALAQRLGMVYLDTGLMYRTVTWASLGKDSSPEALGALAKDMDRRMEVKPDSSQPGGFAIYLDGENITSVLHNPEVSKEVARVAAVSAVRREMVRLQQKLARGGGLIMVGRDIATVVLPDAEVKIFLTANLEERAHRRHLEMSVKNPHITQEEVYADLRERDRIDQSREDSPLEQVAEAHAVDTSGMSPEEVIEHLARLILPDEGS